MQSIIKLLIKVYLSSLQYTGMRQNSPWHHVQGTTEVILRQFLADVILLHIPLRL